MHIMKSFTFSWQEWINTLVYCWFVVWEALTLNDESPTVSLLLSCSSCFLPRRIRYSMWRKFLRSTSLEWWRNSFDTMDSIRQRSSGDFIRAARRNPLYKLKTCLCSPESLGAPEPPIQAICKFSGQKCNLFVNVKAARNLEQQSNFSGFSCIYKIEKWFRIQWFRSYRTMHVY